jgi:hypothetical protein
LVLTQRRIYSRWLNGKSWRGLKVRKVDTIEVRSDNGISDYNDTDFEFNRSIVINLFDPANFTSTAGLYQNASVGSNNRLVTNIAGDTHQNFLAMISFRLLVDGD